jgi:tetratricopeptide (TPR) repeat protein
MIFIVLLVSFAVYFNALPNGFVYDDKLQIVDNRWIKDTKHIPEIFTSSAWSFKDEAVVSNYYRPLMHVIFMGNYYIFGLNPWGFHLINIIFHAAVSVLVFVLILKLLKKINPSVSLLPPFIAALLFATHPIHTEAVTWVSGLTEVSYVFFYLLSFYFYIGSGEGSKIGYPLSLALFFASTFLKETALTLPIILIAYDYSFGNAERPLLKQFRRYIPFFMVAGIYLILRFNALGEFTPQSRHQELSLYELFINVFPLFMQYIQKLLLPLNLNAFYVLHPIKSIFEPRGILSITVVLAFVASALIALKKEKTAFIGLLFIAVPLLPVLYIPALGENTFTERYLYLPSFGFVILAALLLYKAMAYSQKAALSLTLVFILIAGLYSIQTVRRNYIWRDDLTLFTDTVEKSPDSAMVHNNLGTAYYYQGMIDKSIEHYQAALGLKPFYAEAHNNLGNAYYDKGWQNKALEHLKTAVKLKNGLSDAHYNLGIIYFETGHLEMARSEFEVVLKINPNDIDALRQLESIARTTTKTE